MSVSAQPPVILIFAGNDPAGGAGLAADIQAVTALGAHPAPVITALTVQDSANAYHAEAVAPQLLVRQAETLLADMPIAAIKLGLLANAAIGRAVARVLQAHPGIPTVLDPVLAASGGAALADEELIGTYLETLLPLATLITPNAAESRRLAPQARDVHARAAALLAHGCRHVLIKGGDEDTPDVHNFLYHRDGTHQEFTWPRLPGKYHGSGCTLASAIVALLANGRDVQEAVEIAQRYTWETLNHAWRLGKGQAIPNRQVKT